MMRYVLFCLPLVKSFISFDSYFPDLAPSNSDNGDSLDENVPQTYNLINKYGQILAGNRCISIALNDINNELSGDNLDDLNLSKNVYIN